MWNGDWQGAGKESMHFAIARHSKGVNVLFFDSHVSRTHSPRDIWRMRWHRKYVKVGAGRTKKFPARMN